MVSPSNFVHEIVPPFYFLHDAGAFVEAGSYNVFEPIEKKMLTSSFPKMQKILLNSFEPKPN